MTAFIFFAGLLLAGALLWILPPLFGAAGRAQREQAAQSSMALTVLREQLAELDAELAAGRIDAASHAQSREELERRALEEGEAAAERAQTADARPERRWALGLGLSVPVLAVAGYLVFGTPAGLDPANVAGQQGFSPEEIADMVGKLEARLQQEPDNVEGWMMLARSYLVLEDYPKAAATYEKLAKLAPEEPDVYADWADVVAAMKGTVVGEAEELLQKPWRLRPNIPRRSRWPAPPPTSVRTTPPRPRTGRRSLRASRRARTWRAASAPASTTPAPRRAWRRWTKPRPHRRRPQP